MIYFIVSSEYSCNILDHSNILIVSNIIDKALQYNKPEMDKESRSAYVKAFIKQVKSSEKERKRLIKWIRIYYQKYIVSNVPVPSPIFLRYKKYKYQLKKINKKIFRQNSIYKDAVTAAALFDKEYD